MAPVFTRDHIAMASKAAKTAAKKKVAKAPAKAGKQSAKVKAKSKPTAKASASTSKTGSAKKPPKAAAPAVKSVPAKKSAVEATATTKAAPPKGKGAKLAASNVAPLYSAPNTQAFVPMEVDETVCREVACENLSTTGGYCRMHYIKNWKKIKRKELILREKKLNQYIEELVAKYPDKYIDAIRQDLASDKDFAKVISDLDLDENIDDFDMDSDSADSFIDNIRRDFEDEGEGF